MQRLPQRPKPVLIHSIHCNGQRGDNQLEDDTRRPLNQVEGRLKKLKVEGGKWKVLKKSNYFMCIL